MQFCSILESLKQTFKSFVPLQLEVRCYHFYFLCGEITSEVVWLTQGQG